MGHNHISEMRYVRESQCPWLNWMSFKSMANRAKVDVITYMSMGFFFVLARNLEHLQTWSLHVRLLSDRLCNPSLNLLVFFQVLRHPGETTKRCCCMTLGSVTAQKGSPLLYFWITFFTSHRVIFYCWKKKFAELYLFERGLCLKV